jgi:single-strand DNA-binding protein
MSGFTINSVSISGNLTRDPELRSTNSGTAVCGLRIASNERYKDSTTNEWSDRPGYYDITVWKGLGEWIAKNLHKGDQIVVSGRLRWREWQDKDGNNRQAVDISADSIVPVPRGDGGGGSSTGGFVGSDEIPIDTGDFAMTQPQTATPVPSAADDDIPF